MSIYPSAPLGDPGSIHRQPLRGWLSGHPSLPAQQGLLAAVAAAVEPIRKANRLSEYELRAGTRLSRLWGRCRYFGDGRPPEILVRCTAEGDRARWRRLGAIVATLLHEMAHLRYRGHGPRFWALHRRLLDQAAQSGIYRVEDDDPDEGGRGDEKLAGSAADALAQAARARRQARSAANRSAARAWAVGLEGRLVVPHGRLAGARVRVVGVGRGRLTVKLSDGLLYHVPATMVEPL